MALRQKFPSVTSPLSVAEFPVEHGLCSLGQGIDINNTATPSLQCTNQLSTALNIVSGVDVLHKQPSRTDTIQGKCDGDGNPFSIHGMDTLACHSSRYSDEDKMTLLRRGRTLPRTRRVPNPFTRAGSGQRITDASSIEVNARFMKTNPMRSSAICNDQASRVGKLEDIILEPFASGPICASVDEILGSDRYPISVHLHLSSNIVSDPPCSTESKSSGSNLTWESATSNVFRDSNIDCDVATSPAIRTEQSLYSGQTLFYGRRKVPSSYQARSTGSNNAKNPVENEAGKPSVASLIPAEILSRIYNWLSPSDFNSARHSCRSWYINSLEYTLLETMLKRGGWHASTQRELFNNKSQDNNLQMSDEWLMSKHLAKECALGPDWQGNGVTFRSNEQPGVPCEGGVTKTPFRLMSMTDFTNLSNRYSGSSSESCGMLFIVSACTKFLMVARGCMVFVYELNRSHKTGEEVNEIESGAIRPIASIICPRRVLGCSMDTSSNRDAIAILMDGRMGLVCDIIGNMHCSGEHIPQGLRKIQEQINVFPVSLGGGSWKKKISYKTSHAFRSYPNLSSQQPRTSVPVPGQHGVDRTAMAEIDESHLHDQNYQIPTRTSAGSEALASISYPMSTETLPPTLYTLLFSADDPPRSVAICPQRRCVAFGCTSGIELHWIDALTGEDLNRWFPLTAPSDYLYFLPPRIGLDSAKKLRLVSSQGSSGERASASERYFGRRRSSVLWVQDEWDASDMFINTDIESESRGRIKNGSDHYRAIPLSDGYHLLFTDSTSGVLCLGNDAPLGGPTKLSRKLWFSGPVGEGSPVAYAAACDLRWGVRVAAAYGLGREQSVWLFSVPVDVFTDEHERGEQSNNMNIQPEMSRDTANDNSGWLPCSGNGRHDQLKWPSLGCDSGIDMIRPIQIRGQQVGHCTDLVDLAIHTGSRIGVTIWAFSRQGVAFAWNLDNGPFDQGTKLRLIAQDGTVRDVDGDGDIEMPNVEMSKVYHRQHNNPTFTEDVEGNGLMENLQNPGVDIAEDRCVKEYFRRSADNGAVPSFDAVVMARSGDCHHYEYQYDIKQDEFDQCNCDETIEWEPMDLLEELTGVARIDIEIR